VRAVDEYWVLPDEREIRFGVDTSGTMYRNLIIEASSSETDIWLGDDEGHLVQKETGVLHTQVLEGHYTVEFGLGTTTYPIHLRADVRYTEEEIRKGPSCPRPIPKIGP
jgi:hypothetical protein